MNENLFGWDDGIWLLLDQMGILLGNFALLVALGGAVAGFVRREDLRAWLTRNHFPRIGGVSENTQWDGVVFTVSNESVPLWVMAQIQPAHIGLVATRASAVAAEAVAAAARRRGIQVHGPLQVADPNDPAASRSHVALVLNELRQAGCRAVAVDLTGGKLPMSLGAFMAAEEAGVASLYIATDFDKRLKVPDMRTATLRRMSQPE
jgi:hypothetical protein